VVYFHHQSAWRKHGSTSQQVRRTYHLLRSLPQVRLAGGLCLQRRWRKGEPRAILPLRRDALQRRCLANRLPVHRPAPRDWVRAVRLRAPAVRPRYYDPLLGRFISADTIVPDPSEPQDFNRYAYVRNNPLRFVDSSGNMPDSPAIIPEQGVCKHCSTPYWWPEKYHSEIDQWVWHKIPCGVVKYDSGTAGWDIVYGEQVSLQQANAFNWRTGEASWALSTGGAETVNFPPALLSAGGAGGLGLMYGYSSNDALLGPSRDYGLSLQADAVIPKAGLELGRGEEMAINPRTGGLKPAYDDVSQMQPYMTTLGLNVGARFLPNPLPFEASGSRGASQTHVLITWQLYPWKWLDGPIYKRQVDGGSTYTFP